MIKQVDSCRKWRRKMERMTVSRAAQLCGGTLLPEAESSALLGNVVIDSRMVMPGDLFVAYRGERVDGHDYIASAFARGAAGCLVERVPDGADGLGPLILVPDVQKALEQIAKAYREQFKLPIIGITGSVGKTTAKEMISAVLEQHFRTLKTEGNLNNRYGVPMMLSRLNGGYEAAVIEMGISEFGEMRRLARMVRPTLAVYTTIGHAHLEFLHDLDGVLRAKTEMLETMPETAPVVVNGDDEKLRALQCRQRKITYGFGAHCDVRAENLETGEEQTCDIVCGLRRIPVRIPAFGQHYVYAALAAAAVGMLLGLNDREIADGIAAFHNVGRRGETFRCAGLTVVDDSYNANPDSVCNGIDNLIRMPARRHICILGDMLELGENTLKMHYEVGSYAREKGIDLVLTSGTCAREMSRAAGERGHHFESRDELIAALPELLE
jgi:UDP-N-acetylmuramoyl-tripeptide--D-alanyl-D-alanine ligase